MWVWVGAISMRLLNHPIVRLLVVYTVNSLHCLLPLQEQVYFKEIVKVELMNTDNEQLN